MNDDQYVCPPGTDYSIITSPNGKNTAMEVAVMKEHRFAFFYWNKWTKIKSFIKQPALVSIDWHQDLCPPCDLEKEELDNLNIDSHIEVARFSWEKLNPLNDGHILSSAYLNLIGDVYVLCKQEINEGNLKIRDKYGNIHQINCYSNVDALYAALSSSDEQQVFFDIDLDYFTESTDPCGGGENVELVGTSVIHDLLSPSSVFMCWCFERVQGMTIATEPKFCGGLRNSNTIYNQVDLALFETPLFGTSVKWKQLNA